jgi:cytochrome P450
VELVVPDRVGRPAHVPEDVVYDFDIYRFPTHNGEFQLALLELRKEEIPPVFWTPRNGGHWIATRAADIKRVLSDPATFSSNKSSVPKELAPNRRFHQCRPIPQPIPNIESCCQRLCPLRQ